MNAALQQVTVVEYVGSRCDAGQFHGHGRALFSSGQQYEGQWQQGHMHGTGRITFPDGVCYDGSFAADSITGRGVYQWGETVYEGEVQDGLRHGYGTLSYTDSPVVYEGQWQYGKRHGSGTLYYDTDRAAYYEGEWQDDMKHGQGSSVYPSGNRYCGSWARDQREGSGTMTWTSKGQQYCGMWADNMPNGLGEHVWQQGIPGLQIANHATHVMHNRYFGMFKDGRRHGEGSLWYSSGARYEGQWDSDRKQGSGVYVFEDGTVFAGRFAADRPVLQAGAMLGAADTLEADVSGAAAAVSAAALGDDQQQVPASGSAAAAGRMASAAGNSALAAPPAAEIAAASTSSSIVSESVPGFGPRISSPQLYIADLLLECDAPAAAYTTVVNLLISVNTELRALYDRYCNRLSPLLDPSAPRNSWALQAGQLWELLRDSQLLSRHVQLQHASQLLKASLQPPPAVARRRQQVMDSAESAAMLEQPRHLYDPTTELLFRDFCEFLVRLAALRYPQLPRLELQVHQMLAQHLLPLLGGAAGRQGGFRQPLQARASITRSDTAGVPAGAGAWGSSSSSMAGPGLEQMQEEVVMYLQSQALMLQQLFAAIATTSGSRQTPFCAQLQQPAQEVGKAADVAAGNQQQQQQEQACAASAWLRQPVTVRQVAAALDQAGWLQHWQLGLSALSGMLLEGVLQVADPEALRARLDEASLEPEASCLGVNSAVEAARAEAAAAAAAAVVAQEQLFWMDAPLLLVELIWGMLRCAAVMPNAASAPAADSTKQQGSQQDLLGRVQGLLEGPHGMFSALLGMQCLVVSQDSGGLGEPGVSDHQQQEEEDVGEQGQEQQMEAACSAGAVMDGEAQEQDAAAESL